MSAHHSIDPTHECTPLFELGASQLGGNSITLCVHGPTTGHRRGSLEPDQQSTSAVKLDRFDYERPAAA
jgi:hypothetical protein